MAKFTKSFARKMYESINLEDYKREISLSINDGKPYHNPKNKNGYLVDVVISWETKSEGPFNGWHQAQYKGVLILGEYGCENVFMIKSKIKSKIAFKGSPLSELSEKNDK
jgi:hypothetical protein